MSDNKNKESNEKVYNYKEEVRGEMGEDQFAKSTWQDYIKLKLYQFKAQNVLMDNFQLLFLKKYDKLLSIQERRSRDISDWVVQGTSTIANVGSFLFILTQLSITQQLKFNPIRDTKVLLAGITFMFALRGTGILYMWSQNENAYFRIAPQIDLNEQVDFYANNTSNPLKIFLYRNFY